MTRPEYDVFLASRDPGSPVAATVAAGLTRLGFRVYVADRSPTAAPLDHQRAFIEEASDFVLVTTAGKSRPEGGGDDRLSAEIAHALETGSNILWISDGTDATPEEPPFPNLDHLRDWQRIRYNPARSRETVAITSHRLLSAAAVEDRRVGRVATWSTAVAGLLLLAIVASLAIPPLLKAWNRPRALPPLPAFTIHWTGFGQRLNGGGQWAAFDLRNGGVLAAGDQYRLVFSPGSDGHVYVVATDRRGGVRVLFPPVALRGRSRVQAGQTYDVPIDAGWLTVSGQAQLDGLYIIGSHDSLENLEELAEEPDDEGEPKARMDLLVLTLAGLLDGRHAAVPARLWTRSGQVIRQSLPVSPGPGSVAATLNSGARVESPLATERGLVGAAVELRFR